MNRVKSYPMVAALCALTLCGARGIALDDTVSRSSSPAAGPCGAPEYRQFDFWLGDWDAVDVNNPAKVVAHAKITSILDGCVVHEDYQENTGSHGQSFSIYDASRKVWHQSWVTNRGKLLMIEGGWKGDEMILIGADRAPDGGERRVRGIWKPASGGVRETAVTSTDGGKTWQPWFDMMFLPHKP